MSEQARDPVHFRSADYIMEIISHPPTRSTTGELRVRIELQSRWATDSPPEPIELDLTPGLPQSIAYSYPSGDSIDGTAQLSSTPSGSLAVLVNLVYGRDNLLHELEGVVALFSPS